MESIFLFLSNILQGHRHSQGNRGKAPCKATEVRKDSKHSKHQLGIC